MVMCNSADRPTAAAAAALYIMLCCVIVQAGLSLSVCLSVCLYVQYSVRCVGVTCVLRVTNVSDDTRESWTGARLVLYTLCVCVCMHVTCLLHIASVSHTSSV